MDQKERRQLKIFRIALGAGKAFPIEEDPFLGGEKSYIYDVTADITDGRTLQCTVYVNVQTGEIEGLEGTSE